MQKFDEASIRLLDALLKKAQHPVILIHKHPDGDAVGSSTGFSRFLEEAYGVNVPVISPDDAPMNLFLGKEMFLKVHSRNTKQVEDILMQSDLIICMDFNRLNRLNLNVSSVNQLGDFVSALTVPKVLIDHHLEPAEFDLTFSCIHRSSTSELAYLILESLRPEVIVSKAVAEPIMMGIITDTGGFSYNSSQPDTFRVVSKLLEAGVNKDEIIDRVMNNASESRLRLLGTILKDKMKIMPQLGAAFFSLTAKELSEFQLDNGETEGFVNYPLSIRGVIFSAFLREDSVTGEIRISLRSKGNFSVNEFSSQYFNGGGHKNAAGGSYWGSMREAENILIEGLRAHADELIEVSKASLY